MNKYFKEFLHRGLMFGGFGPIILGVIFLIVSNSVTDFSITAMQILIGIISTYFIAFAQAGATVFNQIESWSVPKSTFFHFLTIYIAYVGAYLINSWLPFDPKVILIFTLIFVVVYLIIWITVVITIKIISKKLNSKI